MTNKIQTESSNIMFHLRLFKRELAYSKSFGEKQSDQTNVKKVMTKIIEF